MKLNLGCGQNKLDGFINVDVAPECNPDQVVNLESMPWPWPTSSASEAWFIHSLEHMGGEPNVFLAIMRELYRIMKPGGRVKIHVPHPRHDHFVGDPTHVRAITPDTLNLFNKELNETWKVERKSNSPLALYTGVDFRLLETQTMVVEPFYGQMLRGEISQAQLVDMITRQNNIAYEYRFVLEVRKDSNTAISN